MEELKACPFCGGKAELQRVFFKNYSYGIKVKCTTCQVETHPVSCGGLDPYEEGFETLKASDVAINKWNQRV